MQSLKSALTGKTKLRYHFEIVPKSVEGTTCPYDVSVVCESGSKISYTEPKCVDANGRAYFSSVMRMTSSIYRDKHTLLPKEYTFKVQSVRPASSSVLSDARRKTISRTKINLADYCTHSSAPAATDVQLQLKPQGKLNLSIRAVWLQHYPEQKHGHGSETDSTSAAELSSQFSSNYGDEPHTDPADRSQSVNLDDLADYHRPSAAAAAAAAPAGTLTSRTIPALTAFIPSSAAPTQQQQQQSTPSKLSRVTSATATDSSRTGSSSGRHRRSASTPATITPIIEHDREGLDPAGSLDRSLSDLTLEPQHSQAVLQQQQQQQQQGYFGLVQQDSGAAAAGEEDEPDTTRALSLPAWMWPFGSNTVQGATTDHLMRQIESSAADTPKLQRMCKALLCERNDWRYKATQWERNASSLRQQVDQLQQAKSGILQQLQALEGQLQQLQTNSLVDDLVTAKLQLAQAQEQTITLEGQFNKEKDKSRRLAAQLTAVESKYAMLYEQQAAAAAAAARQQAAEASSAAAPTTGAAAEQGEGLQIAPSTAVGSAVAVASGPIAVGRGGYSSSWGSMFMRAGSYMLGSATASPSNSDSQQQLQEGVRRVSEPGSVPGTLEHDAQRAPRLSIS